MICAECHHRFEEHGDRAVTACDGAFIGPQQDVWRNRSCYCTGYKSQIVERINTAA